MAKENGDGAQIDKEAFANQSVGAQISQLFSVVKNNSQLITIVIVVMSALGVYYFFHRFGLNAFVILGAEDYVVTAFIGTVADLILLFGNILIICLIALFFYILIAAFKALGMLFRHRKTAEKVLPNWSWAVGMASVALIALVSLSMYPIVNDSIKAYCDVEKSLTTPQSTSRDQLASTQETGIAPKEGAEQRIPSKNDSAAPVVVVHSNDGLSKEAQAIAEAARKQTKSNLFSYTINTINEFLDTYRKRLSLDNEKNISPLSDYRSLYWVFAYSILIGLVGLAASLGRYGRAIAKWMLAGAVCIGPFHGTFAYLDMATGRNYKVTFKEPIGTSMTLCNENNTLIWSGSRATVLYCPKIGVNLSGSKDVFDSIVENKSMLSNAATDKIKSDKLKLASESGGDIKATASNVVLANTKMPSENKSYSCRTGQEKRMGVDKFVIVTNPENRDMMGSEKGDNVMDTIVQPHKVVK